MSALKQQKTFVATTAVQTAGNWQIDRTRRLARHVSGLTVEAQASRRGQPSLDLGGLGKIKGTIWAERVEQLVQEAIALLDA